MLDQITPVILCYNEQANLRRSLSALTWAKDVLVIDSFSTDDSLCICQQFPNVRVVSRVFDNFANQCNFALAQRFDTSWILSMDADYVISAALIKELSLLNPDSNTRGYRIGFEYLVSGKPLRRSLYPPRTALYRRDSARYIQDGHAHRVIIDGTIGELSAKIQHDDRKPFRRWLRSQWYYATQEADKLRATPLSTLTAADKSRKLGLAPLLVIPYSLLVKGLILDGWPGLLYSGQRFIAELYLQIARLKRSS